MATAEEMGDPGTWETARELGRQLIIPVGPYDPRVPTPEEMNAVLPYLLDRATTFYEPKYFCANAELALANLLGMNVPRQGFPRASGYSRHGYDWAGFNKDGYNMDGFDKNGFNKHGLNVDGFDKDGYNREGYDAEGFDKKGKNYYGDTRQKAVEKQVGDFTDEDVELLWAAMTETEPELVAAALAAPVKKPRKVVAKKAATKVTVPTKKPTFDFDEIMRAAKGRRDIFA